MFDHAVLLCTPRVASIWNGMIATHFGESLVEGVSDHVVVMAAWLKEAEENRLEFESRTHAAEFEVPQPQLTVGELSIETVTVQYIHR
jgi:hypothetical protein